MTSICNFCWGEDIENGLATREETPNHNRLVYPVYDNHRLFVFYACKLGRNAQHAVCQLTLLGGGTGIVLPDCE